MRNKLLFLGLAVFAISSCSSDDDNSTSIDSSKLTKKWYYVSEVVGGQTFPYDDHEECGKDYIEFVAGGVFREVDVFECEEDMFLSNWSLSGNKITVTVMGEGSAATIKKLNDTTLEVQSKYDYDNDGDEENVVQKFTSIP